MLCMMHMLHDQEHSSQHSQHGAEHDDSAQLKAQIEELRAELRTLRAQLGIPALEIAKAHYARGEISKAEFEELKHDLS